MKSFTPSTAAKMARWCRVMLLAVALAGEASCAVVLPPRGEAEVRTHARCFADGVLLLIAPRELPSSVMRVPKES